MMHVVEKMQIAADQDLVSEVTPGVQQWYGNMDIWM